MATPTILGSPISLGAVGATTPTTTNALSVLSDNQAVAVQTSLSTHNFGTMSLREIAVLCSEAEVALHQTLDGFLERITAAENPQLFELISELQVAVAKEELPALADRILDEHPGKKKKLAITSAATIGAGGIAWLVGGPLLGIPAALAIGGLTGRQFFNKKALTQAGHEAWNEARRIASGSTQNLLIVINSMENKLALSSAAVEAEIENLERLKESYQERFADFVVAVQFIREFLAIAKKEVAVAEQSLTANDPIAVSRLEELRDKYQALESRALALEGTLTRLPADQLVIRQLQNAGITTLQEVATTASERFASIKMTLLSLHGTLTVRGVQELAAQGASLEDNLAAVQGRLMKEVVTKAANAPGDNRLAQANRLTQIVTETNELAGIVLASRASNQAKFEQARKLFAEAQSNLLPLGKQIRPNNPLTK